MENTFDSEFCYVEYKENRVYLRWKKFSSFENYRKPTTFALELLRQYPISEFIIDARNGFEDEKEDVEWGFSFLLPEMAKTQCKKVAFIMNEVNEIEGEMDMWSKEFGKYFTVYKGETYEEVIEKMKHMLWVDVAYMIKHGKREVFCSKLKEQNIICASREEPGNYRYDIVLPYERENEVWLTEIWTNEAAQRYHGTTAHYGELTLLKKEYVEAVRISKNSITQKID